MKVKNFLKQYWQDEAGQTTTEYILILSIVVMLAMQFKTQIKEKVLKGAIDKLEKNMGEFE